MTDDDIARSEAESIANRWVPVHMTARQGLVDDIAAALVNARRLERDEKPPLGPVHVKCGTNDGVEPYAAKNMPPGFWYCKPCRQSFQVVAHQRSDGHPFRSAFPLSGWCADCNKPPGEHT